jgi:hypothetical protein
MNYVGFLGKSDPINIKYANLVKQIKVPYTDLKNFVFVFQASLLHLQKCED